MIYCFSSQKSAAGNLQEEFNKFLLWAHDKELTINVKKTKILDIASPNIPKEGMIKILTRTVP